MGAETKTVLYKIRKFIYLVLCALLGVVLFLFLEQLIYQLLTLLATRGWVIANFTSEMLTLIYSVSTIAALGFGAWYGVWVGSYWHSVVYVSGSRPQGFFYHLKNNDQTKDVKQKIAKSSVPELKLSRKSPTMISSGWQVEDLMSMPSEKFTEPSPSPGEDKVTPPKVISVQTVPSKKLPAARTRKTVKKPIAPTSEEDVTSSKPTPAKKVSTIRKRVVSKTVKTTKSKKTNNL